MSVDSLRNWNAPDSAMPASAANSFASLVPARTDRAAFIGQTGSGKTTLARYLLQTRTYVVALDPKGMLRWPEYRVITNMRDLPKVEEPKIIYRPSYEES